MQAHWRMLQRFLAMLAVGLLAASALASISLMHEAYADDTSFVSGSANLAMRTTTAGAKEQAAYQRALSACMNYRSTESDRKIVVDVSDLGLTRSQAIHAGYLLHGNGELFWANTFDDDSFQTDKFTIPCYYDPATIDSMRAKLEAKVSSAMKRLAPGMSAAMKVHVLHDYLTDTMEYRDKANTAYSGLVEGAGNCFGFSRTMDLLLRRAGFATDMAFNNAGTHSWNLVKVSGQWYNVDVTWDNGYIGKYNWKKSKHCHFYLLQPDSVLKQDTHKGWWSHHACTSKKYVKMRIPEYKNAWDKHCSDYKLYTKGFTVAGLKYKACGSKKVTLVSATGKKRKAKTLSIPATVKHKKVKYKVVGIGANAFKNAKAKTLRVATKKFSAGRVKASLSGSKVKKVKLEGSAKKKKKAYRRYFQEANSGKKVKVS